MFKKLILIVLLPLAKLYAQAPKTYTSSEILLQLKKLNTVGSVLYIAAHPDDENTRLITYLANDKCLRTGYLSLTRGDGGQNLIGPEQGVELGLIRTQELLAARRIDGGEQFFTRAYDFGYSKTPEETLEKWNRDSILSDVVWIIRNFKPDIIITRFASDGSGGHGHHTASAILAEEAFIAAADPTRFKEQLRYTAIWQARRLFNNSTARFRDPKADMSKFIKLDVGGYNNLLGKSYGEIASESRSMHKSQGFGSARQRGEYFEYFKPLKGDTANLKTIFDGIDFSWKRIKGGEKIGKLCEEAIKRFVVTRPDKSIPHLIKIKHYFTGLSVTDGLKYKEEMLDNIILSSLGITSELNCAEPQIIIGGINKITFSAINRSAGPVIIKNIYVPAPVGDRKKSLDSIEQTILNPNQLFTFNTTADLRFAKGSNIFSQPYWLQKMPNGIFGIERQTDRGKPEENYSYMEVIYDIGQKLNIGKGTTEEFGITQRRPVQYRWVDPEKGELYRPIVITPPVLLTMENEVLVFSDNNPVEVRIRVKAGKDSLNTKVTLRIPDDWRSEPELISINLPKRDDEQILTFKITPPVVSSEGILRVLAEVEGEIYNKSMRQIKYDHIPAQTWFPDAEAKLIRLDIKKTAKRIGYIPGAGDEVQKCLSLLGYEVITLTDDMLANDDFKNFDVIITGIRAYNTNPLLTGYKQKLMDFVSRGGNLIVQYNTNSFAGPFKGDIGPKPFKLTRERVTDENARINIDLPNHPVLNIPNKITADDFKGWIQERGIYFAGDIDTAYDCPLSMNDPGEKANRGSLLVTKYGKGTFMYTGLVFFRQLPAGVAGAYRLMVNLIEAKGD